MNTIQEKTPIQLRKRGLIDCDRAKPERGRLLKDNLNISFYADLGEEAQPCQDLARLQQQHGGQQCCNRHLPGHS